VNVLLIALSLVASSVVSEPGNPVGPEVGAIAPPLGAELPWIQLEKDAGAAPDIMALRGKVAVVMTYGYYCDSCVRFGVPTANALRAANPEELRMVALTLGVGDDTPEKIREEAKKLGVQCSIAQGDAEGTTSPYLNMSVNPSLTYAFVIARSGGVLWKGDPSRDRDAYIAAVSTALAAVPCEPLPASMAPELAVPVRAYVEGNFLQVEPAVQAALKKLGSKSNPANDRARSDANALLALVAATKKSLMEELEKAAGEQKPERYERAIERVRRAFPKGECADRAAQLEMFMCIQSPHGVECKHWAEWFALEAARPATFPAEKDKLTSKYAKELAKYVKQTDVPGLERARAWLRDFELAPEHK
jgi:hypothetical protein